MLTGASGSLTIRKLFSGPPSPAVCELEPVLRFVRGGTIDLFRYRLDNPWAFADQHIGHACVGSIGQYRSIGGQSDAPRLSKRGVDATHVGNVAPESRVSSGGGEDQIVIAVAIEIDVRRHRQVIQEPFGAGRVDDDIGTSQTQDRASLVQDVAK